MKKGIVLICVLASLSIFSGCTSNKNDTRTGGTMPIITIYNRDYTASDMTVSELPLGYEYIGDLPKEASNDTGLEGCKMYAIKELNSLGNYSGSYTTDCGINAVAMYLRQLDDYFGGGYLLSTLTTETKLKTSIAAYTNRTVGQLTNLSTTQLATISNGYTNEYGTSHTSISSSTYTWTKFKNTINNGNGGPCILRIGAGATSYWDSAHAVIGVGYTSGATSSSGSIRVNSGWHSLGYVYIGTSIPSHIVA